MAKKKRPIPLTGEQEAFCARALPDFLASLRPCRKALPVPAALCKGGTKKRSSSKRADDGSTFFIAYRFAGSPSKDQAHTLSCFAGAARFLWNRYVSDLRDGKEGIDTPASYKKIPGLEWLREADSLALANVQLDFEKAVHDFKTGAKGAPKFKKKRLHVDSYTTNMVNGNISLDEEGCLLTLPKIKGAVKVACHRKVADGGKLKSVTATHEPDGKWYFSILFEYPLPEHSGYSEGILSFIRTGDASFVRHVGLDMSLPSLFVSSDGTRPEYDLNGVTVKFEKHYRKLEGRISKEQRRLSRMKKDSSNYTKQCVRVAKLHAKARHARKDFLAQLAVRLARKYDIISIEDLDIRAIKRALRFGKSISDNGWGMFVTMLEQKCMEEGHVLIRTDKWFPSSKTCCACGHVHKELELSDRTYACPVCGNVMDRDEQAGVNIDREGLRLFLEMWSRPHEGTDLSKIKIRCTA